MTNKQAWPLGFVPRFLDLNRRVDAIRTLVGPLGFEPRTNGL